MTVWGFFCRPDFNEVLESLHVTKEGAYEAMQHRYTYGDEGEDHEVIQERIEYHEAVVREVEVKP